MAQSSNMAKNHCVLVKNPYSYSLRSIPIFAETSSIPLNVPHRLAGRTIAYSTTPQASLLASHRIVSHIRRDFASKDSLLCARDLSNGVLLTCNLSPSSSIQVVQLLEVREERQPRGEESSCILKEPLSCSVPVGLHSVKIRSLVLVFLIFDLTRIEV